METEIAINTLLQRLPDLARASTSLEWISSFSHRGVRALPMIFAV
jgi:cytochrome P450